jgi:hypothetical protein
LKQRLSFSRSDILVSRRKSQKAVATAVRMHASMSTKRKTKYIMVIRRSFHMHEDVFDLPQFGFGIKAWVSQPPLSQVSHLETLDGGFAAHQKAFGLKRAS